MLGFAVLVAIFLAAFERDCLPSRLRHVLLLFAIVAATQSALTFSRTGIYLAILSIGVASTCGLRDRTLRTTIVGVGITFYLLAAYVIAPRLDAFTHGAITNRFSDAALSRRDALARADLALFIKHPVLGVGPGMASKYRPSHLPAHTEFTRLLAEHGVLGLVAVLLLLHQARRSLQLAKGPRSKAFTLALLSYALLFMAASAMRLTLPAFIFALTFANLTND
jgi:hypothetical protein